MPPVRTRDTPPQSLDVTAHIASPTPRAVSFPFHSTDACPYSSPASSPFEPDLGVLTLTPSMPPLAPAQGMSPPSSHKRRKSSICSDTERRPKKGDDDYIKRPENAFILFRRKCCEDRQAAIEEAAALDGPAKKQRQADLSKTISQQWKALSSEERLYWEELAKEKKREHEQLYPNYVYRPQRSKDRRGKKGKRGEEGDAETTISFVLPLCPPVVPKSHSRSSSAPTPPPCQTIQVPSVYMSCPTSPSTVAMIHRRASHPDHGSASSHGVPPQQQYASSDMFHAGALYGVPENQHTLSLPMGSPASSVSSGSGPASPTLNVVPSDFSYSAVVEAGSLCGVPLGYLPCSWEAASAWGHPDAVLAGDEFDMSAIPPVELGLPGCGDDLVPFHLGYDAASYVAPVVDASPYAAGSQHDTFDELFNIPFDSMLAMHHGY